MFCGLNEVKFKGKTNVPIGFIKPAFLQHSTGPSHVLHWSQIFYPGPSSIPFGPSYIPNSSNQISLVTDKFNLLPVGPRHVPTSPGHTPTVSNGQIQLPTRPFHCLTGPHHIPSGSSHFITGLSEIYTCPSQNLHCS